MTQPGAVLDRPQQQQSPGKGPVLPAWAFPVGVLDTQNASDYDNTKTMTNGSQKMPDVKIEPDGWSRGIWFEVIGLTAANAATVVFVEDAPFSAIDTILFRDTGGEQIFGPFGGYDWMTTNKFGGYFDVGDPRADPNFSATAGAGGTGGSFHFILYLPLEISAADSLGVVENRSENSIYRAEVTLAAGTAVYSTPPTTLPNVEIKTLQDAYTEPVAAMALSGRPVSTAPPSPGTLQYWKQEAPTVVAATQSVLITNGIGHGYREILFKLVRNASTRANGESDWPDPLEITLGTTRIRNYIKAIWKAKTFRAMDFSSVTADTARGLENGVYPLFFNQDVSLQVGNEARRKYLRTKTGNTFKARGQFANAGTVFITSNYIVPRGNDFSQVVA